MQEDVARWWKQSEADIRTAMHSSSAGDYYASAFWAQQAVEKGLKALILHQGKTFRKIHDLEQLAREVKADDKIIDKCRKIEPAYTIARYPDATAETFESISRKDADELLREAEEVLSWIKEKLK